MAVTTVTTTPSPEEGTRGIQVDFKDDAGIAVVPNAATVKWTLTDKPNLGVAVTIINSREQVAITSASTIYITLTANDLALQTGELSSASVQRILTIEYEWNSTLLGNDLPDNVQYEFKIENLSYIT